MTIKSPISPCLQTANALPMGDEESRVSGPEPARTVMRTIWRDATLSRGVRVIAEETAVSLVYDGGSHAVMMASPQDLEDFALGFSLTERIIAAPEDIIDFEQVNHAEGIELRMWLRQGCSDVLARRRRMLAGATGCGLCGIDSLGEAIRKPPVIASSTSFSACAIEAAMAALGPAQRLNQQTHAVHAAGFWTPAYGLVALREDVGRHNALDKLAGALARSGTAGESGILVLTSRISVEMVQKAAVIGVPVVAAVSAPTALALRIAEEAGITLIGVARRDGFEIFTHPDRITAGNSVDVG